MKIVCTKENLTNNINLVYKAISNRTTLPILECILLSVTEEGFKMIANDLQLGIETNFIKSDIIETGTIALEARIFSDIIKTLSNNEDIIIYTIENNFTIIKSGKSEFKIANKLGDEFPILPKVEKENKFKISSNELKQMIRQTIFSVSITDTKPILTGELFEIENNRLNIVAVDSFRVSLRSSNLNTNLNFSFVIPSKSLNEISKILPSNDTEILIYFTEKHVLIETSECKIISTLLEGEFLKYKQILTDDYSTIIYTDKNQILASLERASLVSNNSKKAPVKIAIKNDCLIITSETEFGTFYDEIMVEMEGNDLEIAFNPKYIIDAIKVIEEDKISIQFTTSLSPCIIKGLGTEKYKYLILPLRLK